MPEYHTSDELNLKLPLGLFEHANAYLFSAETLVNTGIENGHTRAIVIEQIKQAILHYIRAYAVKNSIYEPVREAKSISDGLDICISSGLKIEKSATDEISDFLSRSKDVDLPFGNKLLDQCESGFRNCYLLRDLVGKAILKTTECSSIGFPETRQLNGNRELFFFNASFWSLLGLACGTLSAVRILRAYFDVGLRGIWLTVSEAYSNLISEVSSTIAFLLHFSVSDLAIHVSIIYAVLVSTSYRATHKRDRPTATPGKFWLEFQTKSKFDPVIRIYKFRLKKLLAIIVLLPIITLKPLRSLFTSFYSDEVARKWKTISTMFDSNYGNEDLRLTHIRMRNRIGLNETLGMLGIPVLSAAFIILGAYSPIY